VPSGDDLKRKAAEAALDYVKPGMTLGLGTGSTARFFLEGIGRLVARGMDLKGVPTSFATAEAAKELGIPLTSFEERTVLDLAVDGADEVDPKLDLIKGLGGALFREKIVAAASKTFVVIVDASKVVPRLGSKVPVPVEVHPFGWRLAAKSLEGLGATVELRRHDGETFRTDNGNVLLDARFRAIGTPAKLAVQIMAIPGVVGHGLFLKMADTVLVGTVKGVRTLRRSPTSKRTS
jgi:ribose 5-phosphate isomerase A